jgi:hypothetical protein
MFFVPRNINSITTLTQSMSFTQLVRLDTTVKAELDNIGKKKETYSDIIRRLLDSFNEARQ